MSGVGRDIIQDNDNIETIIDKLKQRNKELNIANTRKYTAYTSTKRQRDITLPQRNRKRRYRIKKNRYQRRSTNSGSRNLHRYSNRIKKKYDH